MLQSIAAKAGAAAVVLVCTYALVAGSWRERFGAFIYLTGYLIVLGFGVTSPVSMLFADMLCIPAFFIVNWKSRHPWPRWALGAQTVSVAVEILALLIPSVNRWTFLMLELVAGWVVLLAILMGTIAARIPRKPEKPAT